MSALSDKYYSYFEEFISLLTSKSSYVRTRGFQLVLYRTELCELIKTEILTIDLSRYKDSMAPLIKKDIDALFKVMD